MPKKTHEHSGKIISIFNMKGGCSKSITTINLSHALAIKNKKVLVIDFDYQCNTSKTLTGPDFESLHEENSLYGLLNNLFVKKQPIEIKKYIHATKYKGLSILPNIKRSIGIEADIYLNRNDSHKVFKNNIYKYLTTNFDYVICDNHPSLGNFCVLSLAMSHLGLLPIEAGSSFNTDGLVDGINFYKKIQLENPDLKGFKLLVTRVDKRITEHKATQSILIDSIGEKYVFNTSIPANVSVQTASNQRKTVHALRANSPASIAYLNVAAEIIKSEG